jgi:hypothetical protein
MVFLRKCRQNLVLYAAPLLLCSVAVVQRYLIDAHHLFPWKIGGFGMFSTAATGRLVHFTLLDEKGARIPAKPNDVTRRRENNISSIRIAEAGAMPSDRRLAELADDVAGLNWVLASDGIRKPTAMLENDRRLEPGNEHAWQISTHVLVDQVQVDVWEYSVDRKNRCLRLGSLASARSGRKSIAAGNP